MADDNQEATTPGKAAKSPHQGTADYNLTLQKLRDNVEGKYDIHGTLNALDIRKELEWDVRYPHNGAWKNFIGRLQKILLQEDATNTQKKKTADAMDTKKAPPKPTREDAVVKSSNDKKSENDWYTQRILNMGGEIESRYANRKLGLPVIIITWRDSNARRRCTVYIHLLSGTKSHQIDFDISEDMLSFEFYYEWSEDFLNADTIMSPEKRQLSSIAGESDDVIEARMEAYYQKKQACKQVIHATKKHSEYGEEDSKVDFMGIDLPFPCETFADPGQDPSVYWGYKINTLLKRQEGEGVPSHDMVKVFTAELVGLYQKEAEKKNLEELYHSPSKVSRACSRTTEESPAGATTAQASDARRQEQPAPGGHHQEPELMGPGGRAATRQRRTGPNNADDAQVVPMEQDAGR